MSRVSLFLREFLTPLMVLALAGVVAHDHLVPHGAAVVTPAAVDGKAVGRKFAGSVAVAFGDAWAAAADALEAGKSMADAQSCLQAKWRAARADAFAAQVTPEFAKVLGEGAEPADHAGRAAVVKLWRDFAAGLKGGR